MDRDREADSDFGRTDDRLAGALENAAGCFANEYLEEPDRKIARILLALVVARDDEGALNVPARWARAYLRESGCDFPDSDHFILERYEIAERLRETAIGLIERKAAGGEFASALIAAIFDLMPTLPWADSADEVAADLARALNFDCLLDYDGAIADRPDPEAIVKRALRYAGMEPDRVRSFYNYRQNRAKRQVKGGRGKGRRRAY